MRAQPVAASQNRRIVAGLPFVEALARRMAATMPNSIDIGDLVQDGMIGLIDASSTRPAKPCAASWDTNRRWPTSPPASGPTRND